MMEGFQFEETFAKAAMRSYKTSIPADEAFEFIFKLCDMGKKLEAENADLKRELEAALESC